MSFASESEKKAVSEEVVDEKTLLRSAERCPVTARPENGKDERESEGSRSGGKLSSVCANG